jgi:hypothetical protein
MNVREGKVSCPNLGHNPHICLQGMERAVRSLNYDSRPAGRDFSAVKLSLCLPCGRFPFDFETQIYASESIAINYVKPRTYRF